MLFNLLLGLLVVAIVPTVHSNQVNNTGINDFGETISRNVTRHRNRSRIDIFSTANNKFAFKIFNFLSKPGNNSVMSPISMNMAFSILMNGADNETLHDMRQFLGYSHRGNNTSHRISESAINHRFKALIESYRTISNSQRNSTSTPSQSRPLPIPLDPIAPEPAKLHISNRVFLNQSLTLVPAYESTVREYFNADIQSADFSNNAIEETKRVNEWVSNATNHKITKILDRIEQNTSFIILNAIHFQGQWYKTFDTVDTQRLTFYNNGTTPVQTEMMYNQDMRNYYSSPDLDAKFLELTYYSNSFQESNFSFVVVLPNERNGLSELKQRLNAFNLKSALRQLSPRDTQVYLPKFKAESEYDLMEDIIPKPLFLSIRARFPRLTSSPQIVAEVRHKVYIDVNEKGTEAAAVTAVVGAPAAAPPAPTQPLIFRADHPFLFFIRDRSNDMILFMGQINKF